MPQGAVQQATFPPSMVNEKQMQDAMPASLSCVALSTHVSDQGADNRGTSVQPSWDALDVNWSPPPPPMLQPVLTCFCCDPCRVFQWHDSSPIPTLNLSPDRNSLTLDTACPCCLAASAC